MNIYHGFENLPTIPNPVVTIGSFDGVHHGHRMLFDELTKIAHQHHGQTVVITFDPHPRQVLRGDNLLLSTIEEKLQLLALTGVDNVIVVNFTIEFSKITHTQFIEKFLIEKLGTKVLVTGNEHSFGHNRSGGVESVVEYGIETRQTERFDNISSTQIREAIQRGAIGEATQLMQTAGYLIRTPITDPTKLLPPKGHYIVEIAGTRSSMELDPENMPTEEQEIFVICEI